ncbi:MAG: hypothetical protein U0936_08400 [Planctomycetaceae bacterium]
MKLNPLNGRLLLMMAVMLSFSFQEACDGQTPAPAESASVTAESAESSKAAATTVKDAVTSPDTTPTEPAIELPLPHRPYQVVVEVGFDGSDTRGPLTQSFLTEEIRKGLQRMYGQMWNADVRNSRWLIPANSHRIERLTEADVSSRYDASIVEKVILVGVSGHQNSFEVSCREFDVRVQELTPLLRQQTDDIQEAGAIACRLARDSFRPVTLFTTQSVDKTELEFELQAGSLIPPDPTAAQIAEGDVLRPFLRQLDRRNPGKVKSLQKLDLSYIRVTTFNQELRTDAVSPEDSPVRVEGVNTSPTIYTDNGHVRGVLISHGLVPFGGRARSVQQIALRQRPAAKMSRVRLVLQARPDRPLICFRVDRVSKLRQTDVNEAPGVRMLSDRNGDIEIEVDPQNPTFWLYVYSGSVLLARVPYAPGLIPRDTMKLPDDSVRLGVEGELYLLRDQLVDMVAQKAVHMSIAKKSAAEGNVQGLEAAITQLDALPGQKRFEELLNKVKTDALTKADQQKNTGARRKVDKLCTKMSESLTLFFAGDKRLREAQEIERLRQSAEARAGATAPAGETPVPGPNQ